MGYTNWYWMWVVLCEYQHLNLVKLQVYFYIFKLANSISNPFFNICINRAYDDVIKRKHHPRYWIFVRGIHRSRVNSHHKGQWINGWVNGREAGDLRRHRAHFSVIVMPISVETSRQHLRPLMSNDLNDQQWRLICIASCFHGNSKMLLRTFGVCSKTMKLRSYISNFTILMTESERWFMGFVEG